MSKKKNNEKWKPGRPEDYVRYSERGDYLRFCEKTPSETKNDDNYDKTEIKNEKKSTFENNSDNAESNVTEKVELEINNVNFVL